MLPKIINKWLCNVQLSPRSCKWPKFYFTAWILIISSKTFRIGYPYLYMRFPLESSFSSENLVSCQISNQQTGYWSSLLSTTQSAYPSVTVQGLWQECTTCVLDKNSCGCKCNLYGSCVVCPNKNYLSNARRTWT